MHYQLFCFNLVLDYILKKLDTRGSGADQCVCRRCVHNI